jgi:P-type conjugative transfer protein TrbG
MTMKNAFSLLAFFLATGFSMAVQEKPQEKKDDPPPIIVKRDPPTRKEPIPTPDQYPLTEAVRALQSGDAPQPLPLTTPAVPSLSNAAGPGKPSSEVPRDFQPKRDIALNATGVDALLISRDWEDAHNAPAVGNDGRVVYTYGSGLPIIVCAPLHVCMLELEAGEKLVGEPHIGDSIRWEISPTISGSGPDATPILIIKPRISGLDTTMVVPTDRRAYYVRLQSKPAEYVARVAFAYPEDRRQEWQLYLAKQHEQELQEKAQAERVATLPNAAIENLYWNYEVKGGTSSTRPVHVMDDGAKTYIQMPEGATHRELPVLVVKGPNGSEMVNYRVKDNVYIVDRLFDRAALLLGAGKHQTKVELVRKNEIKKAKTEPVKLPPAQPPANPGEGQQ